MSFKGFATEMVPLQEPDANLGGFLRCVAARSAASRLSGLASSLLGALLQPATPLISCLRPQAPSCCMRPAAAASRRHVGPLCRTAGCRQAPPATVALLA